jgi:hypothetical protein
MNPVIKASLILVAAVAVVQLGMAAAGFHENPIVAGLVSLVVFIGINIGAVVWALKQTAADSAYGKQLMNGAVIGLLGGVMIMAFSFLMLTFIFPNYIQEARDAAIAFYEGSGMSEAQIDAAVVKLDAMTPANQALQGAVGTFGTSVIVAAIAGIFLRKK